MALREAFIMPPACGRYLTCAGHGARAKGGKRSHRDQTEGHFDGTGTSIVVGASNIELDSDATADLVVDADNAANLSVLNNAITVVDVATPTYNSSVVKAQLTLDPMS
jgi:hypothetical protein